MKIRIGFVSNSSTSCYIIVTSKENHERVLASLGNDVRIIMNCLYPTEYNYGGEDTILFEVNCSGGHTPTFYGLRKNTNQEKANERYEKYLAEAKKDEKFLIYRVED